MQRRQRLPAARLQLVVSQNLLDLIVIGHNLDLQCSIFLELFLQTFHYDDRIQE
jgi:hypothetical protein